jgi:uncharacterized protein (DUF427 family)
VIAHVGTQIVADTTRALTLREATYPPMHYIPIDDVDQSLLATSDGIGAIRRSLTWRRRGYGVTRSSAG